MFDVHVMKKGTELPKEGTYYVVGKDKLYLHKDTGIVRALVEVDKISILEDPEPYVELQLPKLPPDIIYRSRKFFAAVLKEHRGESAVVIHYNPQTQQYYLHCPEQSVTYSSVNYDLEDRFEDYQLVGTIHSHCDFNAFHSGTDIHDEEDQDGLHITLGHVNSENFSASGSLVVNGTRFSVALENAALGVVPVTHSGAVRNPHVSLESQNRYQVNLSDEEKAQIDATWDADIASWVGEQVRKSGGFLGGGGRSNYYSQNNSWQSTQRAAPVDPGPDEDDADWDAEAVLRDNDLWVDAEDGFNEDLDDDLADLTLVEGSELSDEDAFALVEGDDQTDLDAAATKILAEAETAENDVVLAEAVDDSVLVIDETTEPPTTAANVASPDIVINKEGVMESTPKKD